MATAEIDAQIVEVSEPDPFVMGRRLGAIIVDSIIVGILAHFVLIGFPTFHLRIQLSQGSGGGLTFGFPSAESILFGVSISTVLYVLYFIIFETLTAATPGKVLFELRVVDRWGMPAPPWQSLVRNVLRPVDAVGSYALGGFVAVMSGHRQRIGDHAAGTMVASVESLADPVTVRRHARRAPVIAAAMLAVVLLIDAAAAIIPPPMVVAHHESFYPVNGTVVGFGAPPARAVRSARVSLFTHSPAHATYAIHLKLTGVKHRTVSCTMQASFVWAGLLQGWQYESMWNKCRPSR